ncbi:MULTISPECIES: helix-turn-helix transcriptional regulator [Cytobacillus]|uniref:helix-turn-helix transcriptional regulator n=1 Tax=Cytobacillus TaxID=2675230 RepID=UPI000DEABDED|nr:MULTISPECIES: helix-turn-helix transcriptional regulator [Cytobacillus]
MNGNIGKNLKLLRLKKRLRQKHVAEAIGVSRITISNYERNSYVPKWGNLEKLAEFYGVSVEEITKKQ